MKEIIKLGLVLFFICAVAALALGLTNEATGPLIKENIIKANIEARKEVFKEADDFSEISDIDEFKSENPQVAEIFKALRAGEHVGYVIKTLPNGYGGPLEVIVGFDLDGVLTGVRVGNHQETPGLGANAQTKGYYSQYNGLSVLKSVNVSKVDVVKVNNEIKALSGATITSDAVTDGVNLARLVLEAFK